MPCAGRQEGIFAARAQGMHPAVDQPAIPLHRPASAAPRTAPYSLLVPVVSLMSGWLVLGERLTALQGLGVLGVLLGVAVTALAPKVTTWLTKRHTADTPAQA